MLQSWLPAVGLAAALSAFASGEELKPGIKVDPARLARMKAAKPVTVDKPMLFDTPEADAILAALEVFPADNPWNLWSRTGRSTRTRRRSSRPSARTSRCATTRTWASSSSRPTRRRST